MVSFLITFHSKIMSSKAHILPFALWIIIMVLSNEWLGEPSAWAYALRTFTCLVVLIWSRPWRWYKPLALKHLPGSIGVGVLVALLWIGPELKPSNALASFHQFYLTWAILPLGEIPATITESPYDPMHCGWFLTLVRLLGSAIVIAIIEEFFWRGFLYRWLIERSFLKVDLGVFHLSTFLIVSILFGLEHNRWLAGIVAGICYGAFLIKTRDIWAVCLAHSITNLLLGVYVLSSGHYEFW